MLDTCAKCNAMHRALSLVEEMRLAAVELDFITYSTLVKGYCCEGDIDHALRVMVETKSLESWHYNPCCTFFVWYVRWYAWYTDNGTDH